MCTVRVRLTCALGARYTSQVTLIEQIRAARKRSGWSVQRLLDESALAVDRSVLQRKLAGDIPCTTEEVEALAQALDVTLVVLPEQEGA